MWFFDIIKNILCVFGFHSFEKVPSAKVLAHDICKTVANELQKEYNELLEEVKNKIDIQSILHKILYVYDKYEKRGYCKRDEHYHLNKKICIICGKINNSAIEDYKKKIYLKGKERLDSEVEMTIKGLLATRMYQKYVRESKTSFKHN
jgi:hypothetical protein